jgi:hypothetical protein
MVKNNFFENTVITLVCFVVIASVFVMPVCAETDPGFTIGLTGDEILLSPSSATATVGDQHTVTATVQDDDGNPVGSKRVNINVNSGPHAGYNLAETTDANGQVSFTYTGTAVGTDVIVASFMDNQDVVITSSEVTCIWEESGNNNNNNNEIPEFPTIALPIAAVIGIAFIFNRRKEE